MMQHQVNVSARFNPETLERVLRVVRHRGFHVCSMNMAAASDAQNINIELTVARPRSTAHHLSLQTGFRLRLQRYNRSHPARYLPDNRGGALRYPPRQCAA